MPLGWIDFSKTERNKVISVLDLLSTPGTLDELGIAPIRDGFANLFFPGTSTIQTRAKYFLLVPYIMKDLEHDPQTNPNRLLIQLDAREKECAQTLLAHAPGADGVIGKVALANHNWVKRTPSDIYWNGLRRFDIFTGGPTSIREYLRVVCANKQQKGTYQKLGSRNDNKDDDHDDANSGDWYRRQFWRIPTYETDWEEDLSIELTKKEGQFLKDQIVATCPDTMFSHILKNDMKEITECGSFADLHSLMHLFPERIRKDYDLAVQFSDFIYTLRVLFNVIVADGQSEKANERWEECLEWMDEIAQIDLESIYLRLKVNRGDLRKFLNNSLTFMREKNFEGLKKEICSREIQLKGTGRAKTAHPGELDLNTWYGGEGLDYRFGNVKTLLQDIFESEELPC